MVAAQPEATSAARRAPDHQLALHMCSLSRCPVLQASLDPKVSVQAMDDRFIASVAEHCQRLNCLIKTQLP
jgi:hypothetical protein